MPGLSRTAWEISFPLWRSPAFLRACQYNPPSPAFPIRRNNFDFVIVALSLFAYTGLIRSVSMLRLFRLFRVFKLAKGFAGLRAVVEALISALPSSSWIVLLMMIINYIFAILGIIMFRDNDPQHFGSVGQACCGGGQEIAVDPYFTDNTRPSGSSLGGGRSL